MAVRILLLLAFTGLFATAWSSDRTEAATRRLASVRKPLPKRPPPIEPINKSLVVAEVGQAVSVSAEFDVSIVVLPELISSGTYRVVNADGRIAWLSIPDDNNPERAATEPQPIYSSESPHGRWYFIRVEAAPVIASPPEENTVRR